MEELTAAINRWADRTAEVVAVLGRMVEVMDDMVRAIDRQRSRDPRG